MKRSLKDRLYDIIFEADTTTGKVFDVTLLLIILVSVVVVMLESVPSIAMKYYDELHLVEWIITIIFTLEYILRIIIVRHPWKYITSFYGVIDLLAVLPTYISIFVAGPFGLVVIRALRLLRVFRIMKLTRYLNESKMLLDALKASAVKLSVFLIFVLILVVIIGALMYLIEGSENGFRSIPQSVYWAIVTLTTVGYGDIAPVTPVGQFLASFVMLLGYAIIAVPTGIVSVEIIGRRGKKPTTQCCPECLKEGHDTDATFCKFCGNKLN